MWQLPSMEVESMYDQAGKYLVGERGRRDPTRGVLLLREAARHGHPGAVWDLSACRCATPSDTVYLDSGDTSCMIDWQRAIKIYRHHASLNHPIALTNLARCYRYARGVAKDMKKSVHYLQKAADQGYSLAQNGLAVCYENGWGVDADFTKAIELYKKAADGGYYRAIYNMGVCYENGEGVPRDSDKAMAMFEKAASFGYYAALVTLGDCYMEGKGKVQDKKKAVELYRQAAEQGDPEGLFSLAGCYLHGLGVDVDIDKALELYGQSGKQGHSSALIRLGYLYHFGLVEATGSTSPLEAARIEKNVGKAFDCYKRCALMGDSMGIQLLYHLLDNEFVERSEQCYVAPTLFQLCCARVNRMLEEDVLNKVEQKQQRQLQSGSDGESESLEIEDSAYEEKSEFEKEVMSRLPAEVRERLHTEKRVCERFGCKKEFYGEGRTRRAYYQRAIQRTAAKTGDDAQGEDGEVRTEGEDASQTSKEAEDQPGEDQAKGNASTNKTPQVAVRGEPVFLCFCSKECWNEFPASLEQAMRTVS